jgi:hypothetical protein
MTILFSERLNYDMILSKGHYHDTLIQRYFDAHRVLLPYDSSWLRLDTTHYVFNEPFWVEFGGYRWDFEVGFITDFLSIPSVLTNLFPTNNLKKGAISALVHDANFGFKLLSFEESNRIFFEMLKEDGFSTGNANLFSLAVGGKVGREVYDRLDPKNTVVRCKVKRLP